MTDPIQDVRAVAEELRAWSATFPEENQPQEWAARLTKVADALAFRIPYETEIELAKRCDELEAENQTLEARVAELERTKAEGAATTSVYERLMVLAVRVSEFDHPTDKEGCAAEARALAEEVRAHANSLRTFGQYGTKTEHGEMMRVANRLAPGTEGT